jgi:hypothetical protein
LRGSLLAFVLFAIAGAAHCIRMPTAHISATLDPCLILVVKPIQESAVSNFVCAVSHNLLAIGKMRGRFAILPRYA